MLAPMVVELVTAAAAACPPAAAASLPGPRVEGVPAAVLAKEAAYAAAAAASFDLHDYVDFGPWFRGALLQVCYRPYVSWQGYQCGIHCLDVRCMHCTRVAHKDLQERGSCIGLCADMAGTCMVGQAAQEMADTAPAARPLRRRAALLIGAWAPKLAHADRPDAYRALLGLMARPTPSDKHAHTLRSAHWQAVDFKATRVR